MPETRIGFFPDVGASYFLPRLPSRCGYWLGLTSAIVKDMQAVNTGLATHYVESDRIELLLQALQTALQDEAITMSASPYSLQITRNLFRDALGLDLVTCLQLEYAAGQAACRHPDLVEGVRAVLVDKDRNPSWLGGSLRSLFSDSLLR